MDVKKIVSQVGQAIVRDRGGYMSNAGRHFMLHYESLVEPVVQSKNEILKIKFADARDAQKRVWDTHMSWTLAKYSGDPRNTLYHKVLKLKYDNLSEATLLFERAVRIFVKEASGKIL